MTHRQQLAILALIAVLLLLAILFPRPAASVVPVVSTTLKSLEFEPVGSAGSLSGLSTPGAPFQVRTLPVVGSSPILEEPAPSPSASKRVPTPTPVRITETPARESSAGSAASVTGRPVPATTPTPLRGKLGVVVGTASWWASFGPGIYAALPGYVAGTHVTIRVCSGSRCVVSKVITSCQCLVGTPRERIVDLSPGILRALGLDQSRGLFRVSVEVTP